MPDNLDNEINEFISSLLGSSMPLSGDEAITSDHVQKYQLPLRHTKGGKEIDENNKPWVIGTFLPAQYVNETHPQGHEGVDLKAARGSPIYPIGPGTVIETKDMPKGGITVKVSHEDGQVVSYYAHMDSRNISSGAEVDLNTVIGTVGDSGNAKGRGTHIHYEVKVDGKKIDPQTITGMAVGSLSKN